jgi:hypothetical protein
MMTTEDLVIEEQPHQEQHEEQLGEEEGYYKEGEGDTNSLFHEQQEFTEQDVLPFLLQAQDIISKLESRVVELETDLSVSIF